MPEFSPPTTWTFELDPLAPRMSLVQTMGPEDVILATPDTVDQVVATFDHSEATPEEVAGLLEVSRKLLRTSVVHYEFAAIAVEKSIQALELAVRNRLGANESETFANLIKRLPSKTTLSAGDIDLVDTGRKLRNNLFAHPKTAVAFPLVMAVGLMETSHRLIAALYSDQGINADS